MSKKPASKKNTPSSPNRAKSSKPASGRSGWGWPAEKLYGAETGQNNGMFQRLFWGLFLLFSFFLLFTATRTGINGDEKFHDEYSEKLVDYYTSFGKDKDVLYEKEESYQKYVKYYGGIFDLSTGLVNRALGFEPKDPGYQHVRHLFNAAFGILILLYAGLLVRDIGGYRAGFIALLLLLASPRLLGHAAMNPKDIPFAAGYMISMYYLFRCLKAMPSPSKREILGFILGAALAIGTRAGGLLVLIYTAMFLGLDFLFRNGLKFDQAWWRTLGRYALFGLGAGISAFILAILFWPYALQSPVKHTLEALALFSKFDVRIRVLFEGNNIMSNIVPAYYAPKWMLLTLALGVLAGIAGAILLVAKMMRRFGAMNVILILFAGLFPVLFIVAKRTPLYDGWRHLLFVYPLLLAASALFWEKMIRWSAGRKGMTIAVWAILGLSILDAAAFVVRNPFYSYTYFNALAGGQKGAFGQYETDYWGVSVKQAVEWMEKEGILRPDMKDTVVIGTHFHYNVIRSLDPAYQGKVKVEYVRIGSRYAKKWDYGIFPTRFIRGPHLRSGKWPTSKTIGKISANGAPLTVIEHNKTQDAAEGEIAMTKQDWAGAAGHFLAETRNHPDDELGWIGLANAYNGQLQYVLAEPAAKEALKIAPDDEKALYALGLAQLNQGNETGALESFQRIIEVNEEISIAHYYLALIYQRRNDLGLALKHAQQSVQYNARFKAGYELTAVLYEQQGDAGSAAQYREAAAKIQ